MSLVAERRPNFVPRTQIPILNHTTKLVLMFLLLEVVQTMKATELPSIQGMLGTISNDDWTTCAGSVQINLPIDVAPRVARLVSMVPYVLVVV